jgi:hypothetical protein
MSIVRAREMCDGRSAKARYSLAALATMALVALAACGSVGRLDPNPSKTVDLSGSWTLDHAASDDPKPLIEKLRPKPMKHRWDMPPDDGLGDDSGPPEGGGQQGGGQQGGRSRRGGSQGQPQVVYRNNNDAYTHSTVIRMLQADLARAESLTIRQDPERFTLDYGSGVRTFTPGAVSVVSAAWGVADQSSGWKGKEFVIHVKPQTGVASVESFSLTDDGKHLVEELELGGGEFPRVKLKRLYNRSDHPVQRDVPTND